MRLIACVLVSIYIGCVGLIQCLDLCDSSLCPSGTTNIGCKNNGALSTSCPGSTSMVIMTNELQQAILESHNTKRNTLATGKLIGFDPAVSMATMEWDQELAQQAEYNVKRCLFEHDACRDTHRFRYSGQNLAKVWWNSGSFTDLEIIESNIDGWWAEYENTTMKDLTSYPSQSKNVIGHFTVMTSYRNNALGCAGIRFRDPDMENWNSFTLACNYARTNLIGVNMYTPGTTASQCTTGKNPNYPALCSVNEPYEINEAW